MNAQARLVAILLGAWYGGCGGGADGASAGSADNSSSNGSVGSGGSGESTGGAASNSFLGTQSPGDVWSWTIDDAAQIFTAENQTLALEYAGSISTLPSGFRRAVITTTNDPALSTPATAYVFEVPNTALLIKPPGPPDLRNDGTMSSLIVAGAEGACPTAGSAFNVVNIPAPGWDAGTDLAYAIGAYEVTDGLFTATRNPSLLDGTAGPAIELTDFGCMNGVLTKPGRPETLLFGPSGVVVGDLGAPQGNVAGFVGMNAPANAVDVAAAQTVSYRGFVFSRNVDGAGQPHTLALAASPGMDGLLHVFAYVGDAQIDADEQIEVGTLEFGAQDSPGVLNASFRPTFDPTLGKTIVTMINMIGGKFFVYGIALNSNPPVPTEPQNFMLLQQ